MRQLWDWLTMLYTRCHHVADTRFQNSTKPEKNFWKQCLSTNGQIKIWEGNQTKTIFVIELTQTTWHTPGGWGSSGREGAWLGRGCLWTDTHIDYPDCLFPRTNVHVRKRFNQLAAGFQGQQDKKCAWLNQTKPTSWEGVQNWYTSHTFSIQSCLLRCLDFLVLEQTVF